MGGAWKRLQQEVQFLLLNLSVKSPSLSPPIPSALTPLVPLFQWYPQSTEILMKSQYEMLKLSI
jgi:hypothetical protein